MTPHVWIGLAILLLLDGVALGAGLTLLCVSGFVLRHMPSPERGAPAGGLPSSVRVPLSSSDVTAAASPSSTPKEA